MQATITLDELHQEEPPTTGKETKQEPTTALALRDEPVIDGEVTAVIEPEQQPTPKQRPYYLIVVCTILACLLFTGVSLIVPLFSPSAIVTIIPRQERISTTGAIHLHARLLPALTLSQSTSAVATGKRHQDAQKAAGTITFYNGLFTSQTIGAGTILTGADGVQIVTDEPAIIPAGTPPFYGQITVSAHAVLAGTSGNIQAFDMNEACCLTSVLAKNTQAFTGGQNARDYLVVTKHDIQRVVTPLTANLTKSEQAALNVQLSPGEGLLTPPCIPTTTADHQIGDEATKVTVFVSETCTGVVYNAQALHQKSMQMLAQQARTQLGTNYSLMGDIQVGIVHAAITDHTKGIATLSLKIDATYIYQIRPGEKEHLSTLLAGKPKQQAINTLLQLPGIQAASIQLAGGNTALPADPHHIHIILMYQSNYQ